MSKRKTQNKKPADWRFFSVVLAAFAILGGLIFYVFAPRPGASIPHYFTTAEAAKPLPETLEPSKFTNQYVAAAFEVARRDPEILAQQPCFCHCDRKMGHRSLLDCFATKHAANCGICLKEAIFASQEHQKGKTAEQIRAEIIQGAWKTIQVGQ